MSLAKPQQDVATGARARSFARASEETDSSSRLPTQDDLPCSDGEPLETERHVKGMLLLSLSLERWLRRRFQEGGQGGYVAANMFLYFSLEQVKNRHFRGPDVMVALGVEPGERKSWVVWQENKAPDVVIELLSDSTRKTDKHIKPRVYRDEVRVREYYWFDPFNLDDFAGFVFPEREAGESSGPGDEPDPQPNRVPDEHGRITSEALGLRLGPWKGSHRGVEAVWMRWYTLDGDLLLTETEEASKRADEQSKRADEQSRRADEQSRRADEQSRRADELAARLRELGVDPDTLP